MAFQSCRTCVLLVGLLMCWSGVEAKTYEKTFTTPSVDVGPGDVAEVFFNVEFPAGRIGVTSFHGDLVDEAGESVPLSDLYLHHWILLRTAVKRGHKQLLSSAPLLPHPLEGESPAHALMHHHVERMAFSPEAKESKNLKATESQGFFGSGAETRKTNITFPSPYVLLFDDSDAPEGHEMAYYANIHAIDTRGAVNAQACYECVCESYNVTVDPFGHPLREGYKGGLYCCYDKTHCAVKPGFQAERRKAHLKYTITWVDMDESVIPLHVYVSDVTDTRTSIHEKATGKTEYDIEQCSEATPNAECIDRRVAIAGPAVNDGHLVLVIGHLHAGALALNMLDKDGVEICSSTPIFGQGTEAGNEAGFVVGMQTCIPEPGSVKIQSMSELYVESIYSADVARTGVMGILSWYVADTIPSSSVKSLPRPLKMFSAA